jgi:pyruvate dehydrogenase E2 component (dihydrolipoamide acetyltransferase)
MKEGTVGRWYKKEGETVEKGEPLVEVVSEKATYDLEAPASGVLRKILHEEGVDAPVNEVLGIIAAPDEAFSGSQVQAETPQEAVAVEEKTLASPAAKRLAREHGVDLSLVKGSGPEGRVVEEDVQRFLEQSGGTAPRVKELIPLTGFRKTSAERVSRSFKTAPHSTITMEVDVSVASKLHDSLHISYTAIIVKAVAEALVEHPGINSTFEDDHVKIYADINIGVAVATGKGLVVPVIRHAAEKSMEEIDAMIKDLTAKAEQGELSREEITGGTFTLTNLGMYEVDFFTPIINPPEAAILGVGRIVERPVAVKGRIEIRPIMMLSLSYDHRVVDGAPAADFLREVKSHIEKNTQ